MEELDDKSAGTLDWKYYVTVARRRIWYFLIPFFLIWLVVWGLSWVLPPVYRSGTFILVEQPTVPQQYVVPNIAGNLQDRLQSITQQILSRTRLLHIISALNLYSSERHSRTPDELVERMRKDIEIELVHSDRDELTAFNVYYSSRDPHVAQQVTSELTNLFISENVEARQRQSESTTKFLESQLEEARKSLAQQEDKVRRYKDEHSGELPSQLQSNLEILKGLQIQLQSEEDALNQAKQQSVYLESLLGQYRVIQTSSQVGGQTVAGETVTGLAAVNLQLDRLNKQLTELSSRYTDRYPDVRKVKEEIARTEKLKQQMVANLAAKKSDPETNSTQTSTEVLDTKEANAVLQLESQLKANQIEVANREAAIRNLQGKIAEYQSRLNQAPIREEQLADLTRGYDQSQANYDSLLKKKNDSELATSLELQQKSEHFRILDPPSLPLKPHFPDRRKLAGLAVIASIAVGAGIAAGAEFIDDRIYQEKQVRGLTGVDIIGEIPPIFITDDNHRQRREMWLQCVASALVFVAIVMGSGLSYFRG